jgi:carbonic anhydrase
VAPDNGMQALATKIMEAMARAETKQGAKTQTPRASRTSPKPAAAQAQAAGGPATNAAPNLAPTEPIASHSRDALKARAAALAASLSGNEEVFLDAPRWSYGGQTGPANWHRLRPSYELCATGQRQAPIAIDSSTTLQGPAEPLDIRYEPVDASVWHTGRTLQVDVAPGNLLTVRGNRYELTALRFQHPGEGSINGVTHPMSVQLWHRSDNGDQLVLAIPLQVGSANAAIHTLWTYLPLDTDDRVPLPPAALDVTQLLPTDLRYFQFMGSLPTPPCTEDVLWLVMKTPTTLSTAQLTLFGQMFPLSARPPQPTHERPVREAL